jgi:hypothetical protein
MTHERTRFFLNVIAALVSPNEQACSELQHMLDKL